MANYYEQFKADAASEAGPLFKEVMELAGQLKKIEQRLADEKVKSSGYETRLSELKALEIQALTGEPGEYEKFRAILKELNSDHETSRALVKSLNDDILPKLKTELSNTRRKLEYLLRAFTLKKRPIADAAMAGIFKQYIIERDDFIDGIQKIHADFGTNLIMNDESLYPGFFRWDEIEAYRKRLNEPSMQEALAAAFRNNKAPKPAETTPTKPVEGQAAAEPQTAKPSVCGEPAEPGAKIRSFAESMSGRKSPCKCAGPSADCQCEP